MEITDTFLVTHNINNKKVRYRVTTVTHFETNSVVACAVEVKTGQIVFRPEAVEGLEDAIKSAYNRLYNNKSKSKKRHA